MITKFKLFENHFDLDPYGEEDWEYDNQTFIKWLERRYPDRNTWNKITEINYIPHGISLIGIENLPNLRNLYCWNSQLTSLEGIENLTNLKELCCNDNQLTSLGRIENLPNLEVLYCYRNQLTNLDGIENLPKLEVLSCGDNLFTNEYKQYLINYCKKKNIMNFNI